MQVSGVIARRSLFTAALAMVLALFSFGASNRVGLDQLARRRGLRWGAAISVEALQQPDLVQLLLANVGSIHQRTPSSGRPRSPGRDNWSGKLWISSCSSPAGISCSSAAIPWCGTSSCQAGLLLYRLLRVRRR